jgi:enoyl-CoA hydratase/carnithine racemase
VKQQFGDVTVQVGDDYVATVEIHRPPNNFFDIALISDLADVYEGLDDEDGCRAIVLCSEGKHFCAGANFSSGPQGGAGGRGSELYTEAIRLARTKTPVVAAVQGAAIGGGLGLACSADFRVACPEARFAANFARLGFHHGFGLTATLPPIVGQQRTLDLLYTGRRMNGEEAHAVGLADRLVPIDEVRSAAVAFAAEIAGSAPLAVRSIRETMRGDLADRIAKATAHEREEQDRLRQTDDFAEGIKADGERRVPQFKGV